MKKNIVLFTLFLSLFSTRIEAEDLGDNQLQIDSSRLEQDEKIKLGSQDQLVRSLFLAPDHERFLEQETRRNQLLHEQKSSLFQGGDKASTDVLQIKSLFVEDSHKNMATKVDEVSGSSGGIFSGLVTTFLIAGIIGLASFLTYRVNKDETR